MPLNKSQIRRYTKVELRRICLENGIHCNTKTSKIELVSNIFKNKQLRSTLPIKPKRQMSDKQKKNLAKFRFKKSAITPEEDVSAVVRKPVEVAAPSKPNPKSNNKVNPTASNKVEPVPVQLKQNISKSTNQGKTTAKATITQKASQKAHIKQVLTGKLNVVGEFGEEKPKDKVEIRLNAQDKKLRDAASFNANKLAAQLGGTNMDNENTQKLHKVNSHTQRLLNRTSMNKRMITTRNREERDSISRTTDMFDRIVLGRAQKKNSSLINEAVKRAKGQEDKKFDGQLDDLGRPIDLPTGATDLSKINRLMLLQAELTAGTITQEQYNKKLEEIQRKDEERVITDTIESTESSIQNTEQIAKQQAREQKIKEIRERLEAATTTQTKIEALKQFRAELLAKQQAQKESDDFMEQQKQKPQQSERDDLILNKGRNELLNILGINTEKKILEQKKR